MVGLDRVQSNEFRITEVGPIELTIELIEFRITEIGPIDVGPVEFRITEVGPVEFRITEVGPVEFRITEVGPIELTIELIEFRITEIGPIGLIECRMVDVGPVEFRMVDVGVVEFRMTDFGAIFSFTNSSGGLMQVDNNSPAFGFAGASLKLTVANNGITVINGGNVGIGTSTPTNKLTINDAAASQLSLSAGTGINQWAFRNAGGNLYFSTTTVAGTATTSISALEISGSGFGTTTVRGLNINGQATTTSNVGINLSSGCFAINGTCLSSGTGASTTLLADFNTFTNTNR